MQFFIEIDDEPPLSGFDIGQIILMDTKTGRKSTVQARGKCYMVFVELSALMDQVTSAKINRTIGKYTLPNGSFIEFDGKKGIAHLVFSELEIAQDLELVFVALKDLIQTSLSDLEKHAEKSDPMIGQFSETLAEISGI